MDTTIPLLNANLASTLIETFCYGIFFVLAVTSIYLLVRHQLEQSRKVKPHFVLLASLALFLVVTAHWILTAIRLFDAFVHSRDGKAPLLYYADLTQPTDIAKTALVAMCGVTGDVIVLHRLWVVWGYNKLVVVFPLLLLSGLAACTIGLTYQSTQYEFGEDIFKSGLGIWITTFVVLSLCLNLYCTAMIAWKIWSTSRRVKRFVGPSTLPSPLAIFVESSVIYTVWGILYFATYEARSNLRLIFSDSIPSIAGISVMLVTVRIGLGWAHRPLLSSPRENFKPQNRSYPDNQGSPMQHLSVRISEVVNQDEERTYTGKDNLRATQ